MCVCFLFLLEFCQESHTNIDNFLLWWCIMFADLILINQFKAMILWVCGEYVSAKFPGICFLAIFEICPYCRLSTRKKNPGKVPKKVHKSEREKLKRDHMNVLFLELGNALGNFLFTCMALHNDLFPKFLFKHELAYSPRKSFQD